MRLSGILGGGCLPALLAALGLASDAGAQLVIGHQELHVAESPHPYAAGSPPGQLAWTHTITHAGASGMWVHFALLDVAPDDRVVVRDPSGTVAETFTLTGRQDLGTFWSRRITGDTIVTEIWSQGTTPGFGVAIDEYAWGDPPVSTEGICGINDLEDVVCQALLEPEALAAARGVARLTVFADDGSVRACTGTRIQCTCNVLTARSCVESETEAFAAQYEFYADSPACRQPPSACDGEGPPGLILSGGALLATSPVHDKNYTLVGSLCIADGGTNYGMQLTEQAAEIGQRIDIPQHAGGCLKQFGMRDSETASNDCELASVTESDRCSLRASAFLSYTCDTDMGSAGAPIVDYDSQRLVGFHHCTLRVGSCMGAAVPLLLILPEIEPFLPARPADVTGLRVTKRAAAADYDVVLAWNPAAQAADYRVYVGRLFQPSTGMYPPASYGHHVDPMRIPADGTCTTGAVAGWVDVARGNWLGGDDDIYYLAVGANCVGLEGSYGSAPSQGWPNPLVALPRGAGCP